MSHVSAAAPSSAKSRLSYQAQPLSNGHQAPKPDPDPAKPVGAAGIWNVFYSYLGSFLHQ